jgi:EAL domain-containing protein (putative c-di-GMP-specific phosphodiesterase class I)
MFRAKESGRARPAVFESSMRARAISHLRFETDLRRAVERGEFVVHYEPIVWLATGGVVGFEASLHWRHPERGLLSPEEFIPLAQKTGLGHNLDQLLLGEACRRAALWREDFSEHFPPTISVNLSADTLSRETLTDEIDLTLKETGLPAHALMIGFSEETITESPEKAVVALGRLKALDVRLAVDDFGTGRSSLGFLHRLPADTLKIDPSFVRHVGNGGDIGVETENRAEVVRTILTMAHEFGMEVVAGGVQTHEQMQALSEIDCDYAQGPRFSQPVNAEKAEAILAAEPSW